MTTHTGLTLVAGGSGFIGSHLCRALLEAGEQVLCLDNLQTSRRSNVEALFDFDGFEFVEADVTEPLPRAVTRHGDAFARIYDLACAASPPLYQVDPEHTMMTNVLGSQRLLRLAESSGARFLLASTSEVYGDPEVHPQREDYRGSVNCTGPRACYDEGKRAAEALSFDFARSGRADVRVARIFNTYGPRMRCDDGRVVSNFVCQALSGEPLTIYGNGEQTRSFCYVADTVRGLRLLMESRIVDPQAVNIGNPHELTIRELVDAIGDIIDRQLTIANKPLPVDDPTRRRPDIGRARALLGWEPETPLHEGLRHTITWFEATLRGGYGEAVGAPSVAAPYTAALHA